MRRTRPPVPRSIPHLLALLAMLACGLTVGADASADTHAAKPSLRDPQDGWLDLSAFLDTAYGFVPVLAPITEPAVGYGAIAALVFIDRNPPTAGGGFVRPNIAAAGGLATENGTDGLFAGHLGTWADGRLKTEIALAGADVNLAFFGLGGDPAASGGLDYTVAASGGLAGASVQVGRRPLWIGVRYTLAQTEVRLRDPGFAPPELALDDRSTRLSGVTASVTFDTRDNFFTPTRGGYLDLKIPVFREDLGGDRDFELATLSAMYFRPLGRSLNLGVRAAAKTSSDGTPFYLRPYVTLRGVQALRYQGEQTAEGEAELRWQFHPRFSLVGFGGVGAARSDVAGQARDESIGAGGAGFRYLVASRYGLHMGLDVAWGPDDPVLYVVFGSQWLRP
jgi:hypothetical protein